MNLEAKATTREVAPISLPDRKYHGGHWILSLPKLPIYSPLLEFSAASFSAACRIALAFPRMWFSLCWGKTRETHCSLFVSHWQHWLHARITDPSEVCGSSRRHSKKPQDAASTPPSTRWWTHQALEEGESHRICPWSHQPLAFPPCGNPLSLEWEAWGWLWWAEWLWLPSSFRDSQHRSGCTIWLLGSHLPCYQRLSWALEIKEQWALMHNCKCSTPNLLKMHNSEELFF